jgi:outer membrane biosynthesis protein TonB
LAKRKTNTSGLLITVIFHLTVIVVLLLHQLDINRQREEVFVMDFTRQEDLEREQKELEEQLEELKKKEDILKKVEEKLAANVPSTTSEVKNLAVNTGKPLKDDRGTDAEQLYKDAEKLQENLKNGYKSDITEDDGDEGVQTPGKDTGSKESYSGPSVLSYTLDGRSATHLPIPAYRCYGGGQVTVIIQVNRQGIVMNAQVNENVSATDKCLREFALRAARQSRFTKSNTAPERQVGEIVYQFIAQ